MTVTLEDWTKLLDVALADTQHTCVTLTELPETPQELQALIKLAREKADAAGMALSRLELPEDRYEDVADFTGAVGIATDVLRLSFSAAVPLTHGRRIVLLNRDAAQAVQIPLPARASRSRDRRNVGLRRARDGGAGRLSDIRQT